MTIGEKIIHLRSVNKISQDELARKLNVTRQAISKWESDETNPSIEKILELCSLFNITSDELINNKIIINKSNKKEINNLLGKPKYFGTDGFRGEANKLLTANKAFKIGRFLGWYYSNPKNLLDKKVIGKYHPSVVIGKDTRRSSYMFEYAIAAGFASSGANVSIMHVTTSPSISFIVRQDKFDLGVMITASHNPFYDNGIKIINSRGEKLDDQIALLIEAYLDNDLSRVGINLDDIPYARKEDIGEINDYWIGRNRYTAYLISLAKYSMRTLKIGLDTANGCSYMIAKSVFEALGAEVHMINNKPNGLNVNLDAGSTHIEKLCKFVKDNKLNVGFAFDGDADRCIAVDEKGNVVDGDKIMYLLANKLIAENTLTNKTIVTTIMSNSGLTKALKKIGIKNIQTNVGDRFVYEEMKKSDYALGGEQSGHIIIRKYATTGDGILTAIMVVEEMLRVNDNLSKLVEDVKLYPQVTKNVKVTSKKETINDKDVKLAYNKEVKSLKEGRILLRESGTEPVIRIMVECPTIKECNMHIDNIYKVIRKRGYVCE